MKTKIILACAFLLLISGCAAKIPLINASAAGDTFATEKLIKEVSTVFSK